MGGETKGNQTHGNPTHVAPEERDGRLARFPQIRRDSRVDEDNTCNTYNTYNPTNKWEAGEGHLTRT